MMRIAPIIALALLTRGLAAQDTTKAAAPAPAPAAAPTPAAVDVAEAVVAKAVVDRQPQGDVELQVGGSPWRTWSKKTVPPDWTGAWHVEVRDAAGTVLKRIDFTVGQ